ncbi:MAG: hypothetical protein WC725_05580 [Patescibacteria group bacterium]|jgi:hypothetical protein
MGEFGHNSYEDRLLHGLDGKSSSEKIAKARRKPKAEAGPKPVGAEVIEKGVRGWINPHGKKETLANAKRLFDSAAEPITVEEIVKSDPDSATAKELEKLFVAEDVNKPIEPPAPTKRRFIMKPDGSQEQIQ